MCFGRKPKNTKRQYDNRRVIKEMGRLGYEIHNPVHGIHPLTQEPIVLYQVWDFYETMIAMIGATYDSM